MNNVDIFEDFKNDQNSKLDKTFICSQCGASVDPSSVKNDFAYCRSCHSITKTQKNRDNINHDNSFFRVIDKDVNNELLFQIFYFSRINGIFSLILTILSIIIILKVKILFLSLVLGIVAIAFFIFAIRNLFDSFYLRVTHDFIETYSKLNSIKKRTFTLKNVDQIYVKESVRMAGGDMHESVMDETYSMENRYSLVIKYKYRADKVIIDSIKSPKHLLSLERLIEDWLDIKDRKVEDEYRNKITRQ